MGKRETLVSIYIKESNKLGKVRYSFAPLNTHSDIYTVLVFPSPKTDLSVGVQTTSRAPFVFLFSGIHHRKGTCKCKDFGRESDVGARRRFRSTDKNIWRPPWGTIQNIVPPVRIRQIQEMRSTTQGLVAPNGGEGLTLQQVMETM